MNSTSASIQHLNTRRICPGVSSEMDIRDLVTQLVAVRYARNMNQEMVAERMGVTSARVGHIETGYRTPNLSTILRYADAIGAELTVSMAK